MYPDQAPLPVPADPHLSAEWFELLRRTALPAQAVVDYLPVGPAQAPDSALLPLLRLHPGAPLQTALSTVYTPLFAPIGADLLSEAALLGHFRAMRQRREVSEIRLAPLDPAAGFFSSARAALERADWITGSYFCFANWYADLGEDGFSAYWARRPSRLRNTARRARRRLENDPGFSMRVIDGGEPLAAAVTAFVSVYGRSWKRPEPYPRFIPELCALAARRGWLRLGVLEVDGQAVASQIWLVSGGCAYIVKLAYDRAYAVRTVGTVLSAHMMEQAIDHDHVNRIDYLIGDDAYKRDWTPERRERHGLIAFNPLTARGLVGAAKHFAPRALKRLRRASP
jgi:hypothetical protein